MLKLGAHQYNVKSGTPISSALFFNFDPLSEVPYFAGELSCIPDCIFGITGVDIAAILSVQQVMELDTDVYATQRDAVRKQLAGVVHDLIREIEM